MKHRALTFPPLAGAALAAFVLLGGCSKAIPVAATRVELGDVRASVSNTRAGTINACRRAKLAPSMGGQIEKLRVHKGDRVKTNQILIELWNDDVKAELDLAVKDAAAAKERADQACTTARVARAEAERWQRMLEQKLVAVDAAQKVIGEADAQDAACRAATLSVKVAEARVDASRATLERTRIRAPFEGTVAEINGELGEFVTPSPVGVPTPPSIDLIDNSCLYITAPIDEVDAPQIRAGMPARITLDAFAGKAFDGHVRRVAPYVLDAEKQARTVEIEAEIDSQEGRDALLPGYSADVEIILAVRQNVLRIPTPALIEGRYVLLIDPSTQKATRREVKTGIHNWVYTEIVDGLKAGDEIVTSIDRAGVVDGVKVKPESPAKPAAKS